MLTYDEALVIAGRRNPNINYCREYVNAFVFEYQDDGYYTGGYGHTPCVILKESGCVIAMLIGEFDVD